MYQTDKNLSLALSGATTNWMPGHNAGTTVTGTAGNDIFYALAGDTMVGGLGDDIYDVWNTNFTIVEKAGQGIDTINSYAYGAVTLPDNVENLFLLGDGSTAGFGNALSNVISAGSVGAYLDGAGGSDVLIGGAGADTFEIRAGAGSDAIYNFQHGVDLIRIDGYGITSFAGLMSHAAQVGNDVQFALPNGDGLVLRGVTLSSLSATDFSLDNNVTAAAGTLTAAAGTTLLAGPGQAAIGNGWYLLNNVWNPGGLSYGSGYTISSNYHAGDLADGTTFKWSFPTTSLSPSDSGTIRAYPELIFGQSPYAGSADAGDIAHAFPIQVGAISALKANYNVTLSGATAGYDVAFDMWLTSKAGGNASTITNEVMVWVHQGDFQAFGDRVGTYTDGAFSASIYYSAATHYTAIVANSDTLAGTIDIAKILGTLHDLGIVSTSEYLADVEFGAEVASGTGAMTVNNLSLDVENVDANGNTIVKTVSGTGTTVQTISALPTTIDGTAGNDTLTGNALNNTLHGFAGDDTLDGVSGTNTLYGGAGNDTYIVHSAADTVIELAGEGTDLVKSYISYVLPDNVENLTLLGSDALNGTGNALANLIHGNAGNNVLDGGAGNDIIHGDGGIDTLIGGAGNDLLYVDNSADIVKEAVGGGTDYVIASVSYTLTPGQEIEYLQASNANATTPLNFTGNEFANTIYGNAGNNILDGGAGNDVLHGAGGIDTLIGGAGNDQLYVDNSADIVQEAVGGGTDYVIASVSYTLTPGQEIEYLQTANESATTPLNLTGNEFANTITGNAGNNILDGGAGNDVLRGGGGDDILIGGTGSNYMLGGAGNDIFRFNPGDSNIKSGMDVIGDFASGDKIDLSGLASQISGHADFSFVGSGGFTGHAGQIETFEQNGNTYVAADLDGDKGADFMVILSGHHDIGLSDFLL